MWKQVLIAPSILLAMAAAITARAASPSVFEYLAAPAGPGNQRNSEGDMLLLKEPTLTPALHSSKSAYCSPTMPVRRQERGKEPGD